LAFEESPDQLKRNMMSVGIDLDRWTEKGLLKIHASRPSLLGLETQLVNMHSHVDSFEPEIVVVDPVTTFTVAGTIIEAAAMLARLIDFLKDANITAMLTSLTSAYEPIEASQVGISSLVDTWIMLRNKEQEGERNRFISVMKSRGMANASSIHGFEITGHGVEI
jgi:circadian clock protein KaiC